MDCWSVVQQLEASDCSFSLVLLALPLQHSYPSCLFLILQSTSAPAPFRHLPGHLLPRLFLQAKTSIHKTNSKKSSGICAQTKTVIRTPALIQKETYPGLIWCFNGFQLASLPFLFNQFCQKRQVSFHCICIFSICIVFLLNIRDPEQKEKNPRRLVKWTVPEMETVLTQTSTCSCRDRGQLDCCV